MHTNNTAETADVVLKKADVAAMINVSESTIDRWSRAGIFPQRLRLGPSRVGWRRSAVEAWLAQR
jgi:prophage regulatory protein